MRDGVTVAIGRATDLDAAQAVLAAREVKYKAIRLVGLRVQAGGDSAKSKEFGLGGVILPTTRSITLSIVDLFTGSLIHFLFLLFLILPIGGLRISVGSFL